MKFRSTYLLLAILVVLIVVYVIAERPYRDRGAGRAVDETLLLFPDLDPGSALGMLVSSDEGETLLEKVGNKWVVASGDSFPADYEAIERALGVVAQFNRSEIVSRNPEKRHVFEVDTSGVEVKIWGVGGESQMLAHFFVGKSGPAFSTTYVRKEGSDEVVGVAEFLQPVFRKSGETWRDRYILRFDVGDVSGLTLQPEEGEAIVLEKGTGDTAWVITSPEYTVAKEYAIDNILHSMSRLATFGFADTVSIEDAGLDNPVSRITLELWNGDQRELLVGKEVGDDRNSYVKNNLTDIVYTFSTGRILGFLKPLEELKEVPPPAEPAEGDAKVEGEGAGEGKN